MTEKTPKTTQTHAPLTSFFPKFQQAAALSDQQQCATAPDQPRRLTCSLEGTMWCHQHPPILCGPWWPWSWAVSGSHLAGATLQTHQADPSSLSKGADNDVFIPHGVMGELQLPVCSGSSTMSSSLSWKSLEKWCGFCRVQALASQWKMPSLVWTLWFMGPSNAEFGGHISRILCSKAPNSMSSRWRLPITFSILMHKTLSQLCKSFCLCLKRTVWGTWGERSNKYLQIPAALTKINIKNQFTSKCLHTEISPIYKSHH